VLARELEGLPRLEALPRIFSVVTAPLRFVELLNFLAEFWNVESVYHQVTTDFATFRVPWTYLSDLQPENIVKVIGTLQSLWEAATELTQKQASVILLKLPQYDERSTFIDLLVEYKIASWADIASQVGLTQGELAGVCERVPLEDSELADLLRVDNRTVARIRQDARRRIDRFGHRRKKNS
jgi:hypothetical protein